MLCRPVPAVTNVFVRPTRESFYVGQPYFFTWFRSAFQNSVNLRVLEPIRAMADLADRVCEHLRAVAYAVQFLWLPVLPPRPEPPRLHHPRCEPVRRRLR